MPRIPTPDIKRITTRGTINLAENGSAALYPIIVNEVIFSEYPSREINR